MLALQAAGIAALVVGVVMVARAPRLGHLRPSSVIPDSAIPGRGGGKGLHGDSRPPGTPLAGTPEPGGQPGPAPRGQAPQPVPEPGAKAPRRPAACGAPSVRTL